MIAVRNKGTAIVLFAIILSFRWKPLKSRVDSSALRRDKDDGYPTMPVSECRWEH